MDEDTKLTVIDGGKAPEDLSGKVEHRGGDTTGGKLTSKQGAFVRHVLAGMNHTEAYRAAGYATERMAPKTVWEAASRIAANSKVSAKITAGRKAQEVSAAHSGASLRLHIEKSLLDLSENAVNEASRIRALELLGKSEKVGFFLDRSTDIPADSLTPEELEAQLADKLKAAFG